MNNLTTKVGDAGFTRNFNGVSISKADDTILAMGQGDLFNVYVGKLHSEYPKYFPEEINVTIQKAISTFMAQISVDSLEEPFNLDTLSIAILEDHMHSIRKHTILANYTMKDWLIYDGNIAQICSKQIRIFEHYFVACFRNHIKNNKTYDELIFLNRLSDYLFYIGLLIQLENENRH